MRALFQNGRKYLGLKKIISSQGYYLIHLEFCIWWIPRFKYRFFFYYMKFFVILKFMDLWEYLDNKFKIVEYYSFMLFLGWLNVCLKFLWNIGTVRCFIQYWKTFDNMHDCIQLYLCDFTLEFFILFYLI